jgi:Kef-type K+ transport system membrane component KefB
LDPQFFIRNIRKNALVAASGTLVPFGAFIGISSFIYNHFVDTHSSESTAAHSIPPFGPFFMYVATIMSITTFPSIARIVAERKLLPTALGKATLSASAVFDVTSWSLLLFSLALAKNTAVPQTSAYIFLVMVAYAALLWFAVRPVLIRWVELSATSDNLSQNIVYIVLCLVLVSAFFTHSLGAHAIFGGFLVGVIVPHSHSFAINLVEKLEDLLSLLFLPLFFFFCGQFSQLDLLNDGESWLSIFMFVVIGSIAKILSVGFSAFQFVKLPIRDSLALGVMMNTKGLVEFVALYIGQQVGVLNVKVYTILLVSVFFMNFVSVPLMAWVYPKSLYGGMKGAMAAAAAAAVDDKSLENVGGEGVDGHAGGMDQKTMMMSKDSLSVVAYLPGMQSVPTLMAFTDLLHYDKSLQLSVTALRLVRLSDRPSTVMIANESESSLRQDAVMSVFKMFGLLSRIPIRGLLAASTIEEFPDQIVATAESAASDAVNATTGKSSTMIVLPWQDTAHYDEHAHPHHTHHHHNHSHADESLRNSLTEAVQKMVPTNVSVATLMDRGFGSANLRHPLDPSEMPENISNDPSEKSSTTLSRTTSTSGPSSSNNTNNNIQRIFLPFFGGKDDREALLLAIRLSKAPNVLVTVLRVHAPASHMARSATGRGATETPYLTLSSSPPSSTSNVEDEKLLETIRSMTSTTTTPTTTTQTTNTTINTNPMGTPNAHSETGLVFEEVPTSAPVSVVIARAHDMLKDGRDLVLMGNTASQNTALQHWIDRELVASIVLVQGSVSVGLGLGGGVGKHFGGGFEEKSKVGGGVGGGEKVIV